MSLLRWTSKSVAKLTGELVRQGYRVSEDTVGRMLKALGHSLQSPAKVKEGTSHPDRDGQFRYLHDLAQARVPTRRSTRAGPWCTTFVDPVQGRAIPYGIFDETNNEGWISVGDIADTAEFAVNSIFELATERSCGPATRSNTLAETPRRGRS